MNWDRDRLKKVLGTKGLSAVIRQNPGFIKFREANLENMRAGAEVKRDESPGLPEYHYDPEWLVERAYLITPEGLGVAERISSLLGLGQNGRDPGDSPSSKSIKEAARGAKIRNLDWELVGGSEHIAKLNNEISYVAKKIQKYDFSVLIEGPSGTGKELIAKGISKNAGRKNFQPINCAALPGTLFESELFGFEKGAFTDAIQKKAGLIEGAEGGILFLDEIGDLAPEHQGKILRLLQEKTYIPLGGKEKKIDDIRIIAATNKDLGERIKAGKFREDLYYRLNHRVIQTISLEERRVDIICLLHYFLNDRKLKIDPRAKALLYTYDFPGNVRELESLLYSADDYSYIKDILAQRMGKVIGIDSKILLNPATRDNTYMKMYAKMRNQIETISDRDKRSLKDNQNLAVFNFFDAIEKIELTKDDWEGKTLLYEILMLWGNTEYSKKDICRILGIRPETLTPDSFGKNFGHDLPDRPIFSAKMYDLRVIRDIALTFYPDFFTPFFDLPPKAI